MPVSCHSHLKIHFIFIIDVVAECKEQGPRVRGPELSPLLICEKRARNLCTIFVVVYLMSQMQGELDDL